MANGGVEMRRVLDFELDRPVDLNQISPKTPLET